MQALLAANRSHFAAILLAALCAWLIFNWFQTVRLILDWYTPVPAWDYWRVPYDLVHYKAAGVRVFWQQHNEHRIFFPEMVFVLDMLVCRGRLILPIALSFLCHLCTWFLIAWTVLSDRHLSLAVRWMAILLSGIVVGWKGSAAVIASPFQLQWTLSVLCVVLALACLTRLTSTSRNLYLGYAIAAGVVATYSSGNALLLWPILLAAGLLLKLNRRRISALTLAAVISVGLYFAGYQFTNNLNIGNLFLHPLYTGGFVTTYLSMPFGIIKSYDFGVYVGSISLVVVILLAALAFRNGLLRSQPAVVLFGYYLFTLLTALLTAAGRMEPADPSLQAAKISRYVTVSLINWAVFILLCIWVSARSRWKTVSVPVFILVFIALLVVGPLKLRWWLEGVQDEFANHQLAALSIQDGLTDRLMLRKIFPDPQFVIPLLKYLRENHLSEYSDRRQKWFGQPASKLARILNGAASAQVSYVFPVESGLEVVGWADESRQHRPPQWILLTNENNQIAGFGRKLPAGFPRHLRSPATAYSQAWVGFVNLAFKGQTFSAYVIDRAGLVPISGAFSVPQIAAAAPAQTGPVLRGIQWRNDPAWTLNGVPPAIDFGVPPPGAVYSSWSGADVNTGQIVSSVFAAPANGCFILPVLLGPIVGGQSVEIRDGDTGQILEHIPMQDAEFLWEFWRISLSASVKHVQIAAQDQGRDWGEWMAISDPAECR